jgi:hypothetical protein
MMKMSIHEMWLDTMKLPPARLVRAGAGMLAIGDLDAACRHQHARPAADRGPPKARAAERKQQQHGGQSAQQQADQQRQAPGQPDLSHAGRE